MQNHWTEWEHELMQSLHKILKILFFFFFIDSSNYYIYIRLCFLLSTFSKIFLFCLSILTSFFNRFVFLFIFFVHLSPHYCIFIFLFIVWFIFLVSQNYPCQISYFFSNSFLLSFPCIIFIFLMIIEKSYQITFRKLFLSSFFPYSI